MDHNNNESRFMEIVAMRPLCCLPPLDLLGYILLQLKSMTYRFFYLGHSLLRAIRFAHYMTAQKSLENIIASPLAVAE